MTALLAAAIACIPANTQPSLRSGAFADVWQRCAPKLATALPDYTIAERGAVFATVASYRSAPYGRGPYGPAWDGSIPTAPLPWQPLVAASTIACDGYAWLAAKVTRRLVPEARGWVIGFDHGVLGNHAQLRVGRLLLDPTVALVADAPEVVGGVPGRLILEGRSRSELAGFASVVAAAITAGSYRASDVIYALPFGYPAAGS